MVWLARPDRGWLLSGFGRLIDLVANGTPGDRAGGERNGTPVGELYHLDALPEKRKGAKGMMEQQMIYLSCHMKFRYFNLYLQHMPYEVPHLLKRPQKWQIIAKI